MFNLVRVTQRCAAEPRTERAHLTRHQHGRHHYVCECLSYFSTYIPS